LKFTRIESEVSNYLLIAVLVLYALNLSYSAFCNGTMDDLDSMRLCMAYIR
jgi:hypothetical protein